MKKTFLFTTLLLMYCNIIYAQEWAPVGAKWYYDHYSGSPAYMTVIESVKDTIIQDKQCRELKSYHIFINQYLNDNTLYSYWDTLNCPMQYTYSDSSKVYLFDEIKNTFYMLYDFNASKGDTITVRDTLLQGYCPDSFPFNLFQYKIAEVSDTIINGITLHKQFVSTTKNSDWGFIKIDNQSTENYPIIERIGSLKYMFGTSHGITIMEGPVRSLTCYEDSSIYYRSYPLSSKPCGYLYPLMNIDKIGSLENDIKIYPNPAKDKIIIENTGNTNEAFILSLMNIQGQEVYKENYYPESSHTIDISNLRNGVYFLAFRNKKEYFVRKIVINR